MDAERLIIDGNNLLHAWRSRRDLARDFPAARMALVRLVEPLVGASTSQLVVVFDGTVGGRDEGLSHGPVEVMYATRDVSADTVIERRVRAAARPGECLVITSDHAIRRACEAAGASTMGCEPFLDWVKDQTRTLNTRVRGTQPRGGSRLGDYFPK
ncbi:MAG: NYN domain-containing protein [Lentisphaerae bacterium]|nr:NYN domain-containing protein [Lentisphaerota bacterium]